MHTAADEKSAKPEIVARTRSATTPMPRVVAAVVDILGPRLTAAIAGVKDVRTLRHWQESGDVPHPAGLRLQAALVAILILEAQHQRDEVAAWFTWLNDELSDRSPAAVLRSATDDEGIEKASRSVVAAARAHLVQ